MPDVSISYISGIAQVCPGMFDEHYIRYYMPQERGWEYYKVYLIQNGADLINPIRNATKDSNFWAKLKEKILG